MGIVAEQLASPRVLLLQLNHDGRSFVLIFSSAALLYSTVADSLSLGQGHIFSNSQVLVLAECVCAIIINDHLRPPPANFLASDVSPLPTPLYECNLEPVSRIHVFFQKECQQ